jgi:serine/threonine-protein kinase
MLMKRGLFIASEEVSTYIRSIFADRIEKREAHLRWAAELTQTGEVEAVKAPIPDFEGSIQSYDSEVQRAAAKKPPQVAAAPKFDPRSTLPLATKSASPGGPPRPAAGTPAIGVSAVRSPSLPIPQPAAPPVDRSAPLADLETMEDDGPTIMAPTPTEEEYDDNDATQVAAKVDIPPAQPSAPRVAPVRPAAGAPVASQDDGDPTRAMVNTAINVPPRPLPPRAPNQAPAPAPVMVAPPPMQQQQMQQQQQQQMPPQPLFSPAAFAPTYSPNDPRLAPAPAYLGGPVQQQPTMMMPRRGVPMWLVGAVSGVAALMVLLVVYLLAVPPAPRVQTPTQTANSSGVVAATPGNGPFGAARTAFTAALTPSVTAAPTPAPTASAAPTTTASAATTDTAPTVTATATATATAAATATATATATAVPTAVATTRPTGPTQITTSEKGFLTLVTLPRCDSWSDNGTTMGGCPIVNKPLPVGTHRITVTTNVPKASKTISVIIVGGQVANPPLVMLQ